jgi:hypothetical protein
MALATSFATALARASRVRLSASSWLAALALVFGFFLLAPASASAATCNVSFTVQENSTSNVYIFNSADLANCDPGFSGISPDPQDPGIGGLYTPSAGGTYLTESTQNDDRITYTPASNFYGIETFQICGEPGTTCGLVTVTVTAIPITLSPTSLSSATVGSSYSATVSASGGSNSFTYTVSTGALPAGLSLNTTTGAISGTPTAGGTFNFTVQAKDSKGSTGTQAYSLTVNAPTITLSPTTLPSGTGGSSYSQTITASGGTSGYTYAVTAGSLPSGLTLSSGGVLSGTPTVGGTFNFTITATDSSTGTGPYTGSRAYTLTLAPPPITLSPGSISAATVGSSYSATITAGNGTGPYTYAVTSGALPAGLSFSSSGAISGTPTAGGTFNFTVTATDSTSATGSQAYSLTVNAPTISLSPSTLPAATQNTAYSQTLTASGGTAGYAYAVTSGALPSGVTLSSSGALSGTPTVSGNFSFTITATDSSTGTGPYAGSASYTLTVAAGPPTITTASVSGGQVGVAYSQTITASGGAGGYSFAVTSGSLPGGLSLSSGGLISGTPTAGGSYTFTVTVTDSSSNTATKTYSSVAFAAPTITVAPSFPANQNVGQATSLTFTASGGTGTYTYAVTAGSLPAGITLSSSGVMSGTATEGGTFNFTITATDSSTGTGPYTGSRAYTLLWQSAVVSTSPTSIANGAVGTSYSQTVSGTGGTAPYTFQITGGALPSGLGLNTSTGVISGVPTASGAFTVTIVATDSSTGTGPYFGGRSYSFSIAAPTVSLTPSSLPGGTVGAAFSQSLGASGGTSPYSYAVTAGSLPNGLSLNSSTGAVTGTPTAGGTFNFTITATDSTTGSGPYTASQAYSVTIAAPTISLSPSSLPAATDGASYNQTITASGGTAGYAYALAAGALPAGMSLSSAGVLSGTPTASGTFNFTVTATDSSTGAGPYTGSRAYSLTVGSPSLSLSPGSLPAATVGAGYNQSVSASGGVSPYSYAVTAGSLPAGVSLNSSTGALTGTPTAGGTFNFTITATDSSTGVGAPFFVSKAFALTVGAPTVTISQSSLPAGAPGASYSQTLTASGGTSGYSFAVTAGALPPGLSLSSSGALTGTPTAGGTFNFTVTATDSSTGSGPYTGSRALSLTINAPTISLTPASLAAATAGTAYSQTLGASGGVGPWSYTVASGSLPPGLTLSSAGALTGTPTAGGTFSFTLRATDSSTGSGPYSGTQAYSLTVAAANVQVGPASLPAGAYGSAYSQTVTASGGDAPYSYTLKAGTLPTGMTLSSAGVLSGTPTQSGTFPITIGATDSSTGTGPFSGQTAYSLVINAPPAPTATDKSVTVAYGAGATLIDLSGSVSGFASSVSIVSAPGHGTVSVSGETVSYTPTTGYYGSDSFTYKASGPGGDSGVSTVHINIPTPAPTAVADTASTPANQAVTIAVTSNDTGPISSISIASAPAHGTAVVNGTNVVYTPAANYFGADSFTYKDVGPGGASAPAKVSVTVQALPVPTVTAQTATVVAGSPVTIHVTNGATGSPFTAVAVASAPAQGTVVVSGNDIVFTPPANFSGQTTFTYTVSNPFGASQPGTITVTVNPLPQAPAIHVTVDASQTTTVDLTENATGGPFTGATVVSLSPSNAGTATITQGAAQSVRAAALAGKAAPAPSQSGAGGHLMLTFVPAKDFVGQAVVTFTLSNGFATSAPSTVTFNVSRPDPSKDPKVTGLISAQNEAVRQMAEAQLDNFDRRLADLHRPDGGKSRFGISFNFGDYGRPDYLTDDPDMRRRLGFQDGGLAQTVSTAAANVSDPDRGLRLGNPRGAREAAHDGGDDNGGGKSGGFQLPNGLAVWASGSVDLGQRKGQTGADRLKFTTAGVSFGVDAQISDSVIMGLGVGYGETDDDIGDDGITRLQGANYVAALYASWEPLPNVFLDGVAGTGLLHFDSRRETVASTTTFGKRDGQEGFGSLIATYEYGGPGSFHLAPYGRVDIASAELGAYSETGDPVLGLTFQRQSVQLLTGDLGLRGDYTFHFRWGDFAPRVRAEYRHDFEGAGSAVYGYTSLLGQTFSTSALPIDHDVIDLGIGADWRTKGGLRFSFDYDGSAATKQEDDHRLQVKAVIPWK